MADNWTGNTLNVADGALSGTGMRYHELAMQRWLNRVFTLRWGLPVPVVTTSPMDAFSTFSQLWAAGADNPFQYLLDAKDADGKPLYQPHPQPVRYPLISLHRKGWKFRNSHNFSIHRMRHINWPTVSSPGPGVYGVTNNGTNITRCNLGDVTTSRFPMAFDYRFQIDHFCNRPDTQAFFISQAFREFWRSGGPQLQTWVKVSYPGFGDKLVRLYIDGDIENLTPEEPEDGKNVEFRTSFNVVLEGYDIDLDYKVYPALWRLMLRAGAASPDAVTLAFSFAGTSDLREHPQNPILDYRQKHADMPPTGTCPADLHYARMQREQVHEMQFTALAVTQAPPGYSGAESIGNGTITV